MKIRLREFAPHIIAMTVVFIFMIISSFVYTTLVSDALHKSVHEQAANDASTEVINISNVVTDLRNEYVNENVYYDSVLLPDASPNVSGYFVGSEKYIEETSDDTLYFYIRVNNESNQYFKVKPSIVVTEASILGSASIYGIVETTGTIYYSTGMANKISLYQTLLNNGLSEENKDLFKTSMQNGTGSYANNVSLNGSDYYLAVAKICSGFYFYTFFDLSNYNTALDQSNTINLVFNIVLGISFGLIFIDLALIVLRSNRILTIRKNSAAKHGMAIMKVNKKGKIKYFARGRDAFGREINALNEFKPISGKTISESLKTESRFIVSFESIENKVEYAEFVSITHQGGYILICNVITEEYTQELELQKMTEHNAISGLPNRNYLFKNFNSMKKEFFQKQVTLAKIKLVEFESVSKTLGYPSGDKLLLESIKLIGDAIVDKGYMYQDENDTLMLILIDTYAKNDQLLNKLLSLFVKPIQLLKSTIFVHIKIGSIELKNVLNKDFNIKVALENVSIALSRSLEQVSVPIVKYDSNLETYVNYRNEMEKDMHHAIEAGEFVMYYQPQYNMHDRRIEGFESLIRWDNPKYNSISPQTYIELAEKNGDIVEIGRFINRSVFKAAKEFEPFGVHLSINVSPAQLIQSGFIDELLSEFKKNDLKKGSVCVEITETYVMQNYSLMIEKLNILRNAGFSIHLDDFGTGYSSMLYLKELPIDTIKTDMEFIRNLESDKTSQVIESQVIKIAKALNLKVICEGVEREAQVELLQEYGADYLQGFIVSRAIPKEKALEMVKNGVNVPGLKEVR